MKSISYFLLLIALSFFVSCKKVEGEGGAATISGTLNGQKINSAGDTISEYPLYDHDVFIIYGNSSTFYDDKISSSYDGTFEFRNLQPGNYTIFLYEKNNSAGGGESAVTKQITIDKKDKKGTVNLGTIDVRD